MEIAKTNGVPDKERNLVRNIIGNMITTHLIDNETTVATALKNDFVGSKLWDKFEAMFERLDPGAEGISIKATQYYRWFKRFLGKDAQGRIDEGKSILCSERLDYAQLGNVLILDGTSNITDVLYSQYEFRHIRNRHDYKRCLFLHWRKENTTSSIRDKARKQPESGVFARIAVQIKDLRNQDIDPFPLVAKADIPIYKSNGVISDSYARFYTGRNTSQVDDDENEGQLAFNIFNTTGKNDLRRYSELAVTNLPIRDPKYYKLKATGLYGTSVGPERGQETR